MDFWFIPTPEAFVIYADHDEYTTFFANSNANLNGVVEPLLKQSSKRSIMKEISNPAAAVDAPIAHLFAFVSHGRHAADQRSVDCNAQGHTPFVGWCGCARDGAGFAVFCLFSLVVLVIVDPLQTATVFSVRVQNDPDRICRSLQSAPSGVVGGRAWKPITSSLNSYSNGQRFPSLNVKDLPVASGADRIITYDAELPFTHLVVRRACGEFRANRSSAV